MSRKALFCCNNGGSADFLWPRCRYYQRKNKQIINKFVGILAKPYSRRYAMHVFDIDYHNYLRIAKRISWVFFFYDSVIIKKRGWGEE